MMYTSTLLLALAGTVPTTEVVGGPSWTTDYGAAREQSAREAKPLVVVLGAGRTGCQDLTNDGGLGSEAREILANSYICVHVNTATPDGKRLAREFAMPSGQGIVISDRTGDYQAFWHEGDLANADLVRYLTRYSDPQYVAYTTATNPSQEQTSYYPQAANSTTVQPSYYPPSYFQPSYFQPSFGGGFCPS
jgi:hypothetical protein